MPIQMPEPEKSTGRISAEAAKHFLVEYFDYYKAELEPENKIEDTILYWMNLNKQKIEIIDHDPREKTFGGFKIVVPTVEEQAEELVEQAKTDVCAHEAARRLASDMISHGENLPNHLYKWVGEYLKNKGKPPRQRGKHPVANSQRNDIIGKAISLISDQGIIPTRNDASSNISACDLVAEILSMDPRNVKRLWIDYNRRFLSPKKK
ncbi:MAG: hypothetical protein ABIM40_00825 [Pseudomonadota bacterium]